MTISSYQHIIGNDLIYNDIDTCIYLDGISKISSMKSLSILVDYLFGEFEFDVFQVVVSDKSKPKPRIRNLKWLESAENNIPSPDFSNLTVIEFFPNRRKTVDETWKPEIYFCLTFNENINSIFMSIRNNNHVKKADVLFQQISSFCKFCAGYIFEFPSIFSSLAYYNGITVDPARPSLGRCGEREAQRLEFRRDNTEIGICGSDGRKFYNVCDGYVRDVYPTMILSECHSRRRIKGEYLLDFVSKSVSVSIEYIDDKIWIRVPNAHLAQLQQIFDENQISLSGRRLVSEP